MPGVKHVQLANGIDVVLAPEAHCPRVAVQVWLRRGSAADRPGQSGYTHLVEHLLQRGSAHLVDSPTSVIASIGAESDGSTTFDYIQIYAVAPANQLETLLWLRSEQVGFGGRPLTEQRLEDEKRSVINEIHLRDGTPFMRSRFQMYGMMFPSGHPYHLSALGREDEVRRATVDDMKQYLADMTASGNVMLVVAGGFEPAEAMKLVDKYFGTLPARPRPRPIVAPPPPPPPTSVATVQEKGPPRLMVAWRVPPPYAPGRAEAALLAMLLGSGSASLLEQRLVQTLGLADSIRCDFIDMTTSSILYCNVALRDGTKPEAALAELDGTVHTLQGELPAAVLARARTTWRARWLRDAADLYGRAQLLAEYWFYTGRTDHLTAPLAQIDAVDAESLRRAAATWLTPAGRVVVTSPGKTER